MKISKRKDRPEMTIQFNPDKLLTEFPGDSDEWNEYRFHRKIYFLCDTIEKYIKSFV
jgi:hypothetical protein